MEFINELPADVLKNIVSFKLGDPKYLKLKHSQALRNIQRKYKVKSIMKTIRTNSNTTFVFGISRGMPFPITCLEYMVEDKRDLFTDFLCDSTGVEPFTPSVYLRVVVSFKTGYEYCKLRSDNYSVMSDVDAMGSGLYGSALDVLEQIEDLNVDKDSIYIKSFHTCLVLDKYVWKYVVIILIKIFIRFMVQVKGLSLFRSIVRIFIWFLTLCGVLLVFLVTLLLLFALSGV